MFNRMLSLLLLAILLGGCASSPVTGRKQLLIVPESFAISSSKTAYTEALTPFSDTGKLNNNDQLHLRIVKITDKLITQAIKYRPDTEQWDWSVNVLDDPETVNAWCMAGGKMAVYTGLIEKIKPTDDELAQVMGHEIAHALAKHQVEKISMALVTQAGVKVLASTMDNPELTQTIGAAAVAVAISLPNSRAAETDSDRIGIELAAKAGFNPDAAVSLWEKMQQVSGGSDFDWLSTHPSSTKRIETLKKLAPSMMIYYQAANQ
jgi:predicted Zn-dependent protease